VRRVVVVGTSGSGKTTVAAALSRFLGVPHVELDALQHERGWQPAPDDVFRNRVATATAGDGWVVCGNYLTLTQDITWPRADTLVFLDLRRSVVMRRVVMRTATRVAARTELWNGNRETIRAALGRDSIIRWAWTSHARNHTRYAQMMVEPAYAHLRWIPLRTPREVRRFLAAPDQARA